MKPYTIKVEEVGQGQDSKDHQLLILNITQLKMFSVESFGLR